MDGNVLLNFGEWFLALFTDMADVYPGDGPVSELPIFGVETHKYIIIKIQSIKWMGDSL